MTARSGAIVLTACLSVLFSCSGGSAGGGQGMEVAGEMPSADVGGEVAAELGPGDLGDGDVVPCSSNEECEAAYPNPGPCLLALCDPIAGACPGGCGLCLDARHEEPQDQYDQSCHKRTTQL